MSIFSDEIFLSMETGAGMVGYCGAYKFHILKLDNAVLISPVKNIDDEISGNSVLYRLPNRAVICDHHLQNRPEYSNTPGKRTGP